MCKGSKWKKLLIDWNEYQETLQASAFSFVVLNLVEKALLHYAELYKSALRNMQMITFTSDKLKEKSRKH